MAYADWVLNHDGGSSVLQAVLATAVTDPSNPPPLGTAWLHLRQNVAGQAGWGSITRDQDLVTVPNYVPGLLRGKVRTLLRLRNGLAALEGLSGGLACMQSARNICVGGASAYVLAVSMPANGALTLNIEKWTNGFRAGGTRTVLATASSIPGAVLALGTTKAVELEWDVNLTELGGVLLTARAGDASNYSNLVAVPGCAVLDDSSPLVTSAWEGLAGGDVQTTSDIFYDETYIFGP